MGAVLELPAKLHCQFSPFWPFFAVNGLDWQCCFAGSSKTAPRILFFQLLWVPIFHLSWIPLRPKPANFLDIWSVEQTHMQCVYLFIRFFLENIVELEMLIHNKIFSNLFGAGWAQAGRHGKQKRLDCYLSENKS